MKVRLTQLSLVIGLVCAGGAVLAQSSTSTQSNPASSAASAESKKSDMFDRLDEDCNGQISREEWNAFREKHQAAMQKRFEDKFKKADANQDGLLSKEEAKAKPRWAKRFDKMDANQDGQLSMQELKSRRGHHGRHHAPHPKLEGETKS